MRNDGVMESTGNAAIFGIDADKVELIRSTVAANATPDELKLFLYHVSRTGLDPMARQIYFQKRFNKRRGKSEMTIITGIDGYRLIADRTGQYAGNDDPVFDDEANPRKAKVTVYKIIGNVRCPFTASARWEQYYPGDEQGFMWRKMPHLMLGKCAEALALRKAFPAELSGIYIKEEMEQAGEETVGSGNGGGPSEPAPEPTRAPQGPPATPSSPGTTAAPGNAPGSDERYVGTEAQRNILRAAFARHDLDNRDRHAIAGAMQDKPMSGLERVIEGYLRGKLGGPAGRAGGGGGAGESVHSA
jgi:phage recombination protein Bet